MTIEEYVVLPFYKQIHNAIVWYCKANDIKLYTANHKLCQAYFQCRAYLNKLPTQTIKNIGCMLLENPIQCSIYDLEKYAKTYIELKQHYDNVKKIEDCNVAEYDISNALKEFLKD